MATVTSEPQIQYVSDSEGTAVGVLVPIELWREIESERETAHLMRSEAMRKRLLEAINRDESSDIPFEEARAKLGLGLWSHRT
jgi:PHD/YefM family antitoxin component YafN of YafNO toxin-antitoxin module